MLSNLIAALYALTSKKTPVNSKYREIHLDKRYNKWYAKYKGKHIGVFNSKEDAANYRENYIKDLND